MVHHVFHHKLRPAMYYDYSVAGLDAQNARRIGFLDWMRCGLAWLGNGLTDGDGPSKIRRTTLEMAGFLSKTWSGAVYRQDGSRIRHAHAPHAALLALAPAETEFTKVLNTTSSYLFWSTSFQIVRAIVTSTARNEGTSHACPQRGVYRDMRRGISSTPWSVGSSHTPIAYSIGCLQSDKDASGGLVLCANAIPQDASDEQALSQLPACSNGTQIFIRHISKPHSGCRTTVHAPCKLAWANVSGAARAVRPIPRKVEESSRHQPPGYLCG
jgi:hypothetical protein